MVNVYLQKETPFDDKNYIGVAITGSESQRHTGIFYNTGLGEGDHFLHLAFHYRLQRESLCDECCWLPLDGFESEERETLALWFDSIWKQNGHRIPYGINYSNSTHFNNVGAWTASSEDGGLTCATFVLALFQDFGLPLIDISSSYCRDSDGVWHAMIIDILRRHATEEYIEKQSVFIGQAARYRPEEVAGAASFYQGSAIPFDTSISIGENVLGTMRSLKALSDGS